MFYTTNDNVREKLCSEILFSNTEDIISIINSTVIGLIQSSLYLHLP